MYSFAVSVWTPAGEQLAYVDCKQPITASIIRSAGLDVPGCQDMPNKELTLDGTPNPTMELSEGFRRRLNRSSFADSCGNTARRFDDEILVAVLLALSRSSQCP